jgi:hypothetical protein
MSARMHHFELLVLDAHTGINGCRCELCVAEKLLNEAGIGPALEHVGRALCSARLRGGMERTLLDDRRGSM